jgi:hypothetical protein
LAGEVLAAASLGRTRVVYNKITIIKQDVEVTTVPQWQQWNVGIMKRSVIVALVCE